jgi:hypothetical protein
MVGAHLFVGWLAGSVLEYFFQVFPQELPSYLFLGFSIGSWNLLYS